MPLAEEDLSLSTLANFHRQLDWIDSKAVQRLEKENAQDSLQARVRCHNCGQVGHKSTYCQEEQIELENLQKLLALDEDYLKQN